jgi:hypothetical protein
MHFARGDMRDHIVSHKNDHGASYWRYGILRWRSRHLRYFRRRTIFDFCNNIGAKRSFAKGWMFHNNGSAQRRCSSKAKMSALSKVEMSVSAPFWEFGGCNFDGHGGDEQARAEPS